MNIKEKINSLENSNYSEEVIPNSEEQNELVKKELQEVKKEKAALRRINLKFQQYWITLLKLIFFYILSYLVWLSFSSFLPNDNTIFYYTLVGVIKGIMFSVDGFVTSMLKTPFSQMCYAINTDPTLDHNIKDNIISLATESNEHCKETLKKFGILAITEEIVKVLILDVKEEFNLYREANSYLGMTNYQKKLAIASGQSSAINKITYICYLIPLFFSLYSIYKIAMVFNTYRKKILLKEKIVKEKALQLNLKF